VWPYSYYVRALRHFGGSDRPARFTRSSLSTTTKETATAAAAIPAITTIPTALTTPTRTRTTLLNLLDQHRIQLMTSPSLGLPELTNENGRHCAHGCELQAWSMACLLETVMELEQDAEIEVDDEGGGGSEKNELARHLVAEDGCCTPCMT
jgi:glycogen debranching enzyme